MQFTLNEKRWQFLREPIRRRLPDGRPILGECSSADASPRFVLIADNIQGREELDTILHELLHAAAWDVLDESFVESTATGISRLLWRLGYRKLTAEQIKTIGRT